MPRLLNFLEHREYASAQYNRKMKMAFLIAVIIPNNWLLIVFNHKKEYSFHERVLAFVGTPLVLVASILSICFGLVLAASFSMIYPFQYLNAIERDRANIREYRERKKKEHTEIEGEKETVDPKNASSIPQEAVYAYDSPISGRPAQRSVPEDSNYHLNQHSRSHSF